MAVLRNIVFLMPLKEERAEQVIHAASNFSLFHGKDTEELQKHLKHAEIVVGPGKAVGKWLKTEDVQSLPLRWIHTWSAGVDELPFGLLKANQVLVSNSSGIHAYPISETIFAMILGHTRKIPQYVRNMMEKKWDHSYLAAEAHEKTIGIIGTGAIGQETARIANAFRMNVLGVRRSGEPMEHIHTMYAMDQMDDMLGQCDFIVNCLPSTSETYHLFGSKQFSQMKQSAFFVNIGRGLTVDMQALTEALQQGEIGGAGLDVFEEEPLPASHPLWDMENVIITPHTAGNTMYYHQRAMELFLQNLNLYIKHNQLTVNQVDLDRQY